MQNKSYSRVIVAACILAALLSGYYALYLQGIPYEEEGAVDAVWIQATDLSWGTMLGYLFSPASYVLTAGGHGTPIIRARITDSVVHKALFDLFGDSMHPIYCYNLAVAVAFGLLIFLFVRRFMGSTVAGFLCAAFTLTTPAYGWDIMDYGNSSPVDQLLLLAYLLVFLTQCKDIAQGASGDSDSTFRQVASCAFLWFLGMLAIRAKEHIKIILPILSWSVLFILLLRQSPRRKAWTPLVVTVALLTLPAVWFKPQVGLTHFMDWNSLAYPLYLFFWNPFGWEPEKACGLFSWHRMFPASVLSNFGFFLSWALVLSSVLLIIRRLRKRLSAPATPPLPLGWMLAVWILATLPFHVMHKNLLYTKYLTWLLLPFALLVAHVFVRSIGSLRGKTRTVVAAALVLLATVKIADNVRHSLYIRQQLESVWNAKWWMQEKIYRDRTGAASAPVFDLFKHWYVRHSDLTNALEPYLMESRDRSGWEQDPRLAEHCKQYGTFYLRSDHPLNSPRAALLGVLDTARLSFLTSLQARWSRRAFEKVYLYRIR